MLKQELQSYFDRIFPGSQIDKEQTVFGQVHIRFELGGDIKNGTKKRVNQSTSRASTLFNDIFDNPKNEIFVLIYEYPEPNAFNASNEYLHRQFPADLFKEFYIEVLRKNEVRIIIGKLAGKDINIRNILNGIANTEMGFDPGIDQKIMFFDPSTDRAFHMYDDRGCFIWSNTADKIRDIYAKRKKWIVDYHRLEIDEYFERH